MTRISAACRYLVWGILAAVVLQISPATVGAKSLIHKVHGNQSTVHRDPASVPDLESCDDELLIPRPQLSDGATYELLRPREPLLEGSVDELIRPRYTLRQQSKPHPTDQAPPRETASVAFPAASSAASPVAIPNGDAPTPATIDTPATTNALPSSIPATQSDMPPVPTTASSNETLKTQLSELERHFFQTTYTDDSDEKRMEKLEKFVFGEGRHGSLLSRLQELKASIASEGLPNQHSAAGAQANNATTAPDAFARGMDLFNQRAYHAAEEAFECASTLSPGNPEYHYWLARDRQQLNDAEGAHGEFEIAFRLNPFGKLAAASKEGMLATAERSALEARPPVDTPDIMKGAISTINSQAKEAMGARLTDGLQIANWRIRLGDIEADNIERQANSQTQDAYTPRFYGNRYGNRFYPGRRRSILNWNDRTEISNLTQVKIAYQLADARVQATRAQTDARIRATAIEASANSLYQLLAQPYKPGEPRLRAFGTNLYVRYYGSEPSDGLHQPPPVDPGLKASPLFYPVIKKH